MISLKHCTLDMWCSRSTRENTVSARLDANVLLTPLFNPHAHSPVNHITKTVLTTPTT